MHLLAFGFGEFVALFSALGALVTALYLFAQTRRKRTVSTLRFWTSAAKTSSRHPRRVREPWSLFLQLLALALLLLAIGDVYWGNGSRQPGNRVILVDLSIASAQRVDGRPLLEREKALVRQYLGQIPASDLVQLVGVDELVTPLTSLTAERDEVLKRLDGAHSSALPLDLPAALRYANRVLRSAPGNAREIVYAGPGRTTRPQEIPAAIAGVRVLPVNSVDDNLGIGMLSVTRAPGSAAAIASITMRNDSPKDRPAQIVAHAGPIVVARRSMQLPPGESTLRCPFAAEGVSRLEVRLENSRDSFPQDDSASVDLLENRVHVVAVTSRPAVLTALLQANHDLDLRYISPSAYNADVHADVLIFDQPATAVHAAQPALWIDPAPAASPIRVASAAREGRISGWGVGDNASAHEVAVAKASIFLPRLSDTVLASMAQGPIAVERPSAFGSPPQAVLGFDPAGGTLRFEVMTPLLLRQMLRWLAPGRRTAEEAVTGHPGLLNFPLAYEEKADSIRITDRNGRAVPFSVRGQNLSLFQSTPDTLLFESPHRRAFLPAALSEFPGVRVRFPARFASGLPGPALAFAGIALWRPFAACAALLLGFEWWRYSRRRRSLTIVKVLGLLAVAAALFDPSLKIPNVRSAAVLLLDASESIGDDLLQSALSQVREMERHRGTTRLVVAAFAKSAQMLPVLKPSTPAALRRAAGETDVTNLENALTDALSLTPAGYRPAVVLMSDGNENDGNVIRAIAELQASDVAVTTLPLRSTHDAQLRISSVSMPQRAFAGASIPIDLTLQSAKAVDVSVSISAGNTELGREPIHCVAGTTKVRVRTRVHGDGPAVVSGVVSGPQAPARSFRGVVSIDKPTALYLSGDPPDSDNNLIDVLKKADFAVTQDHLLLDQNLPGIELLILNNLDWDVLPLERKTAIQDFVDRGGGLLVLSGEHQVYKQHAVPGPLERVLPAAIKPPENPEGICVMLVIDKSSSMEGRKIELARLSAVGVVDHLRPVDTIGILIFDNTHKWAVPPRRAVDKNSIKRLIAGIVPDGGTQIPPALAEAYRRALTSKATYKHIVLLTDGISEEGDSVQLAKDALFHQVTISTVGLGQDVNKSYLERIAGSSGGKSYFLNDPQDLQQILLKDVQDFTGKTAVEKPFAPIVEHPSEILNGVDIEHAPSLKGYVRFSANPGAQTILSVNSEHRDPLLVRWQYGLGRAAVFTSDAKSRWAGNWIGWPGFDRLWVNVARDLAGSPRGAEATATIDRGREELEVEYRTSSASPLTHVPSHVFAFGPAGSKISIPLLRKESNRYSARASINWEKGLWIVRPESDGEIFPETGVLAESPEVSDSGVNEFLLKEIATATGGKYDPPPSSVFEHGGERRLSHTLRVWPTLLSLAIALTLAELFLRKTVGANSANAWQSKRAA